MKGILLALAVAALVLPAASGSAPAAKPRTVVTGGAIVAFAMDGTRIAWIAGSCQTVRVGRLGGKAVVLGNGRVTECDNRGTPSRQRNGGSLLMMCT